MVMIFIVPNPIKLATLIDPKTAIGPSARYSRSVFRLFRFEDLIEEPVPVSISSVSELKLLHKGRRIERPKAEDEVACFGSVRHYYGRDTVI